MKRRADGTGSIFKDARGYWTAQIAVGYTPAGRVKYRKKRSKVQADVIAWMKAQDVASAAGVNLAPERITVGDYFDRWLQGVERANRYSTHKAYAQLVKDHIKPSLGKLAVQKLRVHHVQALLDDLDKRERARNTIRNVRACMRAAFKGTDKEYPHALDAVRNAKLPVVKKKPAGVHALTPEQARTLLAAVEPLRTKALYWVALLLGLRQGELLALRVEDVDLKKKTLRVEGAHQPQKGKGIVRIPTKTDASETLLPLPAALVPVLREHLAMLEQDRLYSRWQEKGLLFPTFKGTPISARNLFRDYKKILKANDLPDIRFHDLRHSCASLLISLNVHPRVVMEILRHTQISTTMNLYGHVIPGVNRDAVDQLGELVMPERLEMPERTTPQ